MNNKPKRRPLFSAILLLSLIVLAGHSQDAAAADQSAQGLEVGVYLAGTGRHS